MPRLAHPFGIRPVVRHQVPWTPFTLGASVAAWWSAEDLADGAVGSWPNRKGGTVLPINATGTQQPIRAATSFNSFYPGVTFDGTDDRLSVAATTGIPTGTTSCEIWYVGSFIENVNAGNCITWGGASAPNFRAMQKRASASGSQIRITDGNRTLDFAAGSALGAGHIVGAFFQNGVPLRGRLDGVAAADTSNVTLTTGTGTFRLGSNSGGSPSIFHHGVSVEYLIITGILSDADRLRLEGYWAWRFGLVGNLPSSHTYKASRPLA